MTARSGTALADSRMRASLAASRYLIAPESSEQLAQCGNRAGHSVPGAWGNLAVTSVQKKKSPGRDESASSSLKPLSLKVIALLR